MCRYKSGIVLKDDKEKGGFKLLMSPWTESHSELELLYNLRDGARLTYAKVEFYPESMKTAHQPESYQLHIDEERTPEWFSEEMKESVSDKMRVYIKSIIVSGEVNILMGGQFILAPGAKVGSVKNALVITMLENSSVQVMRENSSVQVMRENSSVQEMWGNSSVQEMWGNSSVQEMWGNSSVQEMWGNSSVQVMRENSSVQVMRENSSVKVMRENSSVKDPARIKNDYRAKK